MILLARLSFLFLENPVPDLCLSDPRPDQKLQKKSYTTVGINAEAGGTAISKVMINMALAVETGGKELTMFADVAGKTSADFARQFETDAAGAIQSFITGLGQMKERGRSTLSVLEEMGITEVRMRDALLRASGAGDLLNRSLEIGVRAWEENTALTKEAEVRYKTLASQLTIFWNNLKDVAIELGGSLAPALQSILNLSKPLIESLGVAAKWFAELPQPVQTVAIALAGVAAAAGPALIALGAMLPAITAITGAIAGAGGLVAALTMVVGVLTGPVGWIAAIGAATYALGSFLDKFEWWRREILRTKQGAQKLNEELLELGIVVEQGELRIDHWADKLIEAAQKAGILGEDFRRLSTDVESTGAASTESKNQFEELMAKISESSQKFVDFSKTAHDANTTLNTLTESQRELADRLKDLQALPQEVAEQIAFLERAGFSAEQQFALLSGRLDELVRASELVKLQIPDSAQELIEFGEAAQAAQEQFHDSFVQIGESIKGQASEVGQLIKSTDSWGKSVAGLEEKLKGKLKTLAQLEKEAAKTARATGQNVQGFAKWAKGTSDLRKRIRRLSSALRSSQNRMMTLKKRAGALKLSIEADQKAFKALQKVIQEAARKELKNFQKKADEVKDSIDQKTAALIQAQEEYENLAGVMKASEGQLEQLDEALDGHKENLGDVGDAAKGMAKKHQEATDEAAREAERLGRVWEETMGNVVASISGNLTDALFEAKNFADGMKKTFKEMAKGLVQILIAELFSPLRNMMLNLGKMLGSLFSGKGTGGLNFGNLFGGGGLSPPGGLGGGGGGGGLQGEGGILAAGSGLSLLGGLGGGGGGGGGLASLPLQLTGVGGNISTTAGAGGTGGFGAIGGGAKALGSAVAGGAKALWAIMASNPITAAIAGAAALGYSLYRLFTQGPIEAGGKELVRDFGVDVGESAIKGFLPGVGLSEKQFKPIRKDILSSGKFLENILVPAAKAQGKLDELIANFARFETSWGTFDLSGPLREAVESGNFEAYNEAWEEVFKRSNALTSQFGPGFGDVLGGAVLPLDQAAESIGQSQDNALKSLAEGQANQVIPLLSSINEKLDPDPDREERFVSRAAVVERGSLAEVIKQIIQIDEAGIRETIREVH